MSEKKSWDIRPNPRRTVRIDADSVTARRPAARALPAQSLRERRRSRRKRLAVLFLALLLLVIGASVYGIWRPEVRIQEIGIQGFDSASLLPLAQNAIAGTYMRIVPKNSIFFFPKQDIRSAILEAYPKIAAVSVARTGFHSIKVTVIERVSAFDWCGVSLDATAPCYQTDAEGYVFEPSLAALSEPISTSTQPRTLRIYAPLIEGTSTNETPIRLHVANPSVIPDALRFVRAMQSLGGLVTALQIRDDEADVFVGLGTRITYIIGHEQEAADLAATGFPSLSLNDGSLTYIDLRFPGKVYYKKAAE